MKYFALILASVMLVALSGCPKPTGQPGSAPGEEGALPVEPLQEKVYRFPLPSDPPTLDPMHITDTVSDTVARRVFNGLVRFSPSLEIVPDLAENWVISDDGLTYKFFIRRGVKFHNGDDVTARDFLYSFTRILDAASAQHNEDVPSERAQMLFDVVGAREFFNGKTDSVAGFSAPDDQTFIIRLKENFAPFLSVLCMSNFVVVPRDAVERDWRAFAQHPVGTGPFVFDRWEHDSEIVLKANRSYWDKEVKLDVLVFKVMPDENTRYQAFLNGDLDHTDIPFGKMAEVNANASLKPLVQGVTAMDMYCYGFNCTKPPFDNKLVRLAFNHAVDKEAVIKNILEGRGEVQKTYFPPGAFYFKDESEGYPYDPIKAKAYLEKAGYPDGNGLGEVTLSIDTQQLSRQIAAMVQEDLRQIGVKVNIEQSDWSTFLDRVYAGELTFHQNTWLADYPDPDNWLYILLETSQAGAPGNTTRFSHPQFDQLVRRARKSVDEEERIRLYGKAEDIALAAAPWLLLYWRKNLTLVQPYVRGLQITAMDRTPHLNNSRMEDVYLER